MSAIDWRFILRFVIFLVAQIGVVYTCTAWLMPKFLYQKRILVFILLLLLSILFFAFLLWGGLKVYVAITQVDFGQFFNYPQVLGPTLGSVSTSLLSAFIAKLVKDNYHNSRRTQQLEKENLEQEVKFLKSQLDPHFLFNALNNIYWQIKKEPKAAADSLAKFSDMLRYQLYDGNEDKISLQQEVDYLKNYIEVAKLGYDEAAEINLKVSDQLNGQMISPLMLIPFAENSLKHLGGKDRKSFVDISLEIDKGELSYSVRNSKSSEKIKEDSLRQSGIGLKNLTRRLNLLYPGKHIIEINDGKDVYEANLKMKL